MTYTHEPTERRRREADQRILATYKAWPDELVTHDLAAALRTVEALEEHGDQTDVLVQRALTDQRALIARLERLTKLRRNEQEN